MLKRRAPSPAPPSSSSIMPLIVDDQPPRKRPRPAPTNPRNNDSDDGEEDDPDATDRPRSAAPATGEYTDTNTVLHDLHVLNQHRRLFTSPSCHSLKLGPEPNNKLERVEGDGVQQRYENNRLLGNLFLSRRKQLDH
ncbi:hypothetical protein MKEN_00807600 [Mycena kentingensis (nom. inval.)]|nr:hypothetical protein MKEN_00807600 [Mycena kentingensis (nom. inval.)]